ncbi:virulence factor TspB C-terminal domain-related protein [Rhodoferax sp.]|uniref:virulence factor TspB C-terminal domain-related protein n=1 Tax=Rhodoferax sp. TaxID=50421 RepID=UPI0025F54DF5|nr:virulence factor TspB C-terminal domain-related protein [Rhodoferax sp.]
MNTTTKKNDLRRRTIYSANLALVGLVIGLAAGPSLAQTSNAGDAFNWMYYQTNGNTVSVSPSAPGSAIRDMGWGGRATSTSDIGWSGRPSMRNGSGNAFAIDVIAKTPASKAAKILSAGAKALPIIGTGVFLWDLCNELGYQCSKTQGGQPEIKKVVNGQKYCIVAGAFPATCVITSSPEDVCSAVGGSVHSKPGGVVYCSPWINPVSAEGPPINSETPVSIQDLEDAIASKSGWPTNSSIHEALQESARATGQKIPLESPVVSGPSSSPGTTKTTSNPATNTTTTTTTNHTHNYNDNRVTNNVTTSVSVTNNTTGQTDTSTTTEQEKGEQSECEINPKAWGCSDLDTPEDEVPKKEKQITFTPENLGLGNGSCPAPIEFYTSQGNYSLDLAKYCDATVNYVRPVVILFGMLAAFFIAVPGGVRL